MLSYLMALAVALGGFALYMAAFFFPEVHRKGDFIWSGVAMFYALVLWFCAGRITGAVLLGEAASVALLGWFGWETLRLRREVTPIGERTQVSQDKLSAGVSQLSGRVTDLFKGKPQQTKAPAAQTAVPKVQTPAPDEPEKAAAQTAPREQMPPTEEEIVAATATPTEARNPEVPAAAVPAPPAAVEPAPAPTQTEPEKIPAAAALEGATAGAQAPAKEEELHEEGFEPEPAQTSVQAKPPAAKVKDKAKPASSAGAGKVLAPVSGALSKLQEGIQGLVSKINKPKSQPAPKTPPAKAVPDTAEELSDDEEFPLEMDATFEEAPPKQAKPESIHIPVGSQPRAPGKPVTEELEEPAIGKVELQVATLEIEVIVEGVAIGVEPAHSATTAEPPQENPPQLVRPNPPSPELVEAAWEPAAEVKDAAARVPVEEIAPEAELAPPAEAPPEELPEPEAVTAPAPEPATATAPVEQSTPPAKAPSEETPPQLVRPNPPSPELVEAAWEPAAEVKDAAARVPVEEIAPEAELAPPAEAPPEELPEPEAVTAPAPEPATTTAPVEQSTPPAKAPSEETPPQLVRPNPPSPELVEAAWEPAAEVKDAAARVPVEEIAPEAELAPPALCAEGQIEAPAAAEPQPAAALEVPPLEEARQVPEAAPPAPLSEAEAPKQEEGFAKLLRPKRTDPAMVEAAKKPAEAKSVTPPPADSEASGAGEENS